MRVCMVVFGDLRYDFRVYREACTLREAGHEVSIVAPDVGRQVVPDLWDVFRPALVPLEPGRSLRRAYPAFWRRATRLAKAQAAHVYHAHDLDALWPAALAARHCRACLVYDSHELFTEQSSLVSRPAVRAFWLGLEHLLVQRADRVLAVSPAIAGRLEERYRLPRPVAVVRNVPPFRQPAPSGRLRAALHLGEDPLPLALYQGGFLTDNGLAEQIEAMRSVRSGRMVLLGSGPTEAALHRQVINTGCQDRVHFLGRVPFPNLHEYTCGADLGLCVIKPAGRSFCWSLPNKLFEYLMAGLPVIGGDTPEIRAVVEDTGAGIVVNPLDPRAIGQALEALLANADLRTTLAAAARRAARRLCWEQEAPRLLEVYASL